MATQPTSAELLQRAIDRLDPPAADPDERRIDVGQALRRFVRSARSEPEERISRGLVAVARAVFADLESLRLLDSDVPEGLIALAAEATSKMLEDSELESRAFTLLGVAPVTETVARRIATRSAVIRATRRWCDAWLASSAAQTEQGAALLPPAADLLTAIGRLDTFWAARDPIVEIVLAGLESAASYWEARESASIAPGDDRAVGWTLTLRIFWDEARRATVGDAAAAAVTRIAGKRRRGGRVPRAAVERVMRHIFAATYRRLGHAPQDPLPRELKGEGSWDELDPPLPDELDPTDGMFGLEEVARLLRDYGDFTYAAERAAEASAYMLRMAGLDDRAAEALILDALARIRASP